MGHRNIRPQHIHSFIHFLSHDDHDHAHALTHSFIYILNAYPLHPSLSSLSYAFLFLFPFLSLPLSTEGETKNRSTLRPCSDMAGASKHSFGFGIVAMLATLIFALYSMPAAAVNAQTAAPAPAPSSDGSSLDQGIAYVLMLLALVLTYIIHS